jgi:hypothetical protein
VVVPLVDDNYLGRFDAIAGHVCEVGLLCADRTQTKAHVLPGNKITDHQVQKYKQHCLKFSQVAAAAKDGLSERSARRIEHSEPLPSQRGPWAWRTRIDLSMGRKQIGAGRPASYATTKNIGAPKPIDNQPSA